MLHLLTKFALVASCLGGIAHGQSSPDPQSLSAAYEALLGYTAYLIDASLNGNKSVTIDPDCASAYDGASLCSFDEFIVDIGHGNQALIGLHNIIFQPGELDQIADQLVEAGAKGPWNARAFGSGAIKNSGDIASLVVFLTNYVAKNAAASLSRTFYTALTRSLFLRGLLNSQSIQQIWRNRVASGRMITASRELYPGGPSYDFFDLGATAAANPGADISGVTSDIAAANVAADANMNVVRAGLEGQSNLGTALGVCVK